MLSSEITLPEASPDKEEALVSTRKDDLSGAETVTADELTLHFSPTEEEIEFTTKGARSSGSRLSWLVLLKLFQRLPRFPSPDEISPPVINPLRIHLRLGAAVEFEHDDPVQRARELWIAGLCSAIRSRHQFQIGKLGGPTATMPEIWRAAMAA